jgi:hypothetical protein
MPKMGLSQFHGHGKFNNVRVPRKTFWAPGDGFKIAMTIQLWPHGPGRGFRQDHEAILTI